MEAGWYPAGCTSAEARLRYYASRFSLVEVDSTYYHLPSERNARLWAERTPEGFAFDVKAFSLLTGHPTRVDALPRDLRGSLARGSVYARDLPVGVVEEVAGRFRSALRPLHESGRLGVVLLQFPPWFLPGAQAEQYILRCRELLFPYRVAFEPRNGAWVTPETFAFLGKERIPYVCVDMPQGHVEAVPPVVRVTAELAIVRLHGRSAYWGEGDAREKYRHDYTEGELAEWVPRIRRLARDAKEVHVLLNNCCGASAVTNAATLREMLMVA
ncbi:DUF72 domain-containing protein [Embleya sp. NPDC050493]|uniref:DUF72 domain-containing protein n=1 Tax=Embleya sp. NPDC050493 TaxID=3363989 RepID=UPI0037A66BDF